MINERGVELAIQAEDEPTKETDVFYNTKMVTNRDISVLGLQVYADNHPDNELHILDALSASGIRGLRYANEVDTVSSVTCNDSKPDAVEAIKENIERNNLDNVTVDDRDANVVMSENRSGYDVIDLDPFGSPARFTDSAARGMSYRGMAGITATDLGTLCGTYRKTCRRRYASWPIKASFCHEAGLRILMNHIFESFARFDKVFRPKISFAQRHYYRVIGEVRESKKGVNRSIDKTGFLGYCWECAHRDYFDTIDDIDQDCPHCGETLKMAGPMWVGELGDRRYLAAAHEKAVENEWEDAADLLELLKSENIIKKPYYDTHNLAAVTKKQAPRRDKLLEALREKGYEASKTHFAPTGIRTTCPVDLLKEMI